jgi:hypothetical protein
MIYLIYLINDISSDILLLFISDTLNKMFEGLISSVLNRVLGNFVENLDAQQLNISLWNGSVSLTDLQVKSTLFDAMPVPF